MVARCNACTIEFQPKTPKIETKDGKAYHAGCWAKINRALLPSKDTFVQALKADCSHYTPAEDASRFAFAHRTWGCPDEGAVWPHGYNV